MAHTSSQPSKGTLKALFDQAVKAGGQPIAGRAHLPPALGEGYLHIAVFEPGIRMVIHHLLLRKPFKIERTINTGQSRNLYLSFISYDEQQTHAGQYLSSVQVTSDDISFDAVLPAGVKLFMVSINIEKDVLRNWIKPADKSVEALLSVQKPIVLDMLVTQEIQEILNGLSKPGASPFLPPFFYKIRLQELIYWLFAELSKRPVRTAFLNSADAAKTYKARELLLASLDAPPSLSHLAKAAGLSEAKLKQSFSKVFGTSPYEFLQHARMNKAAQLLKHYAVSEVGYQLGFTNLSHFARLFKRYHAVGPKKFQLSLPA